MKKLIAMALICTGSIISVQAQSDSTKPTGNSGSDYNNGTGKTEVAYDFYPDYNIYLNPTSHEYSWYDAATSKWVTATALPSTVTIDPNAQKTVVNYSGSSVWTDNAAHQKKWPKSKKKQ